MECKYYGEELVDEYRIAHHIRSVHPNQNEYTMMSDDQQMFENNDEVKDDQHMFENNEELKDNSFSENSNKTQIKYTDSFKVGNNFERFMEDVKIADPSTSKEKPFNLEQWRLDLLTKQIEDINKIGKDHGKNLPILNYNPMVSNAVTN